MGKNAYKLKPELAGHGKSTKAIQPPLPLEPKADPKNENYTPESFIKPCREFLGGFDLDPFSCWVANRIIQASTFWSIDDDALKQDWSQFSRKWINPPYSGGLMDSAIAKSLEYCDIGETLLLVNSSTSTKWFHSCMEKCSAYLHPRQRVQFTSPDRVSKKDRNRYDQALFYFGDRPIEFAEALYVLGDAVMPIRRNPCSNTLTSLPELVDLPSPASKLELPQPNLSRLIPMPNVSYDRTGHTYPYIARSETTNVLGVSSILLQPDFPVQAQAQPEAEPDWSTNIVDFGTKPLELLTSANPDLSSSKTQPDYSIEEWEQSSKAYPKAGTWESGRLSPQPHLERPTKESEYLSLPTLTSNIGTYRKAGQSKCEKWFRDNGLLQSSQCLSPQMMALLLGFPMDWTRSLWESKDVLGVELLAESCLAEPLSQSKPRSPCNELGSLVNLLFTSHELPLERDRTIENPPLEHSLQDRLADLEKKRAEIMAAGPIAPSGVWIEYGKVSKRKFRQAYYRSAIAIFPPKRPSSFAQSESGLVKRQYIGEEGSKQVKAAGEAIARRNELERIAKEIKLIERNI